MAGQMAGLMAGAAGPRRRQTPYGLKTLEIAAKGQLTPNPDYKIFPARLVKKLFWEPERAPKMVQKQRKSLPNG